MVSAKVDTFLPTSSPSLLSPPSLPRLCLQITEVGSLDSNQTTITFYIVNLTVPLPLLAVDVVEAFQVANQQEVGTYQVRVDGIYLLLLSFS